MRLFQIQVLYMPSKDRILLSRLTIFPLKDCAEVALVVVARNSTSVLGRAARPT